MSGSPAPVVTGVGVLGAAGVTLEELACALRRGTPSWSTIDQSGGFHGASASRLAGLVEHEPAVIAPLVARRMCPSSRFAVCAARAALAHADLAGPVDVADEARTAVCLATAFGPSSFTQRLLDQMRIGGPESASPALFSECVANAPAAQVAIHCRARGPNHMLAGREAGPVLAIARGAAAIVGGSADRVLAGGVDELSPLVHALLDRLGALARARPGTDEVARPFDRRRNGFIAAEGALVLVVEAAAAARARGALARAQLRAWGSAFDPTASRMSWGRDAAGLARAIERSLARAGLDVATIDLVVSGASGSRAGDRLEALTVRRLWRAPPPVLAPKSVTGEYGGAFVAAALLALAGHSFAPTAGFSEPDPELGLVPHDGSPLPPVRRVLVLGTAAGGSASWLVLERGE